MMMLILSSAWGTGLLRRFVAVVLLSGGMATLLSVVYFECFHGR
jgi:hypothetical protein